MTESTSDDASEERALKGLLQYFRQEPARMYCVGAISLWLCGGYPIERIEKMMDSLVASGVLRLATPQELAKGDCHPAYQGYFLTADGLASLPPEDRSGPSWRLG